jgi:hypothetical protein
MRPRFCVAICAAVLALLIGKVNAAARLMENQKAGQSGPSTCPVTLPRKAPAAARGLFGAGAAAWNGALYVGGLWPAGTMVFRPGGSGFILPDGSMSMKFGWLRGEGLRGKLKIHGRRLDAPAPPLRAEIPEGYGDSGFQATGIVFPTEGCGEVTGEVGEAQVTFVTRVLRSSEPK